MRVHLVLLLTISVALAGCVDSDGGGFSGLFNEEPADGDTLDILEAMDDFPEWRIEIDGQEDIRAILYTGWLPTTTDHIITITERDFYARTFVHRIVDDFVIQGGDSTCSKLGNVTRCTGEGGSGPQGQSQDIPLEIKEGLDFGSGSIGLARWTNDTGDSQYFITEKPAISLSRPERSDTGAALGAYSLFAQVFAGQDTVRAIAAVPVDDNDQPIEDVVVFRISVQSPPDDVDLLNLIPEVYPDVATQGYDGTLETSRILVTGHETVIRFTAGTPAPDDGTPELLTEDPTGLAPQEPEDEDDSTICAIQEFILLHPDGTRGALPWTANAVDPCTFEHAITFEQAGEYIVDLGVHEITLSVLPWHDDYAPYTGTAMNEP